MTSSFLEVCRPSYLLCMHFPQLLTLTLTPSIQEWDGFQRYDRIAPGNVHSLCGAGTTMISHILLKLATAHQTP